MLTDILSFTGTGLLYLLSLLLMAVGVAGCLLPYPGHLVLLAGCAVWAAARGEPYPSCSLWLILALLALLGTFVDNISTMLGARKFGCSRAACWWGMGGLVIGSFFFFPAGMVVGPFLGAFAAEAILARRSLGASTRSGMGALVGLLSGVLCKFLLAGLMTALFLWG